MHEWWISLTPLNQFFYAAAAMFSVIFTWQFVASLVGVGGHEADIDLDSGIDADGMDLDHIEAHSLAEAGESTVAFHVFSVRAVLAFCTMFSWAGALYLDTGRTTVASLSLAFFWGLAGWGAVAVILYWLRKLAESGTQNVGTCVGREGIVYLNIPADGQGEVRMTVSGRVTMLKARSADGTVIRAGTPVRATRALDDTTVEVTAVTGEASESPGQEAVEK
jgi:hypothetical protein